MITSFMTNPMSIKVYEQTNKIRASNIGLTKGKLAMAAEVCRTSGRQDERTSYSPHRTQVRLVNMALMNLSFLTNAQVNKEIRFQIWLR